MTAPSSLFDPISVGALRLANRIAMAPLTRNRAADGNVPTDLHATYYAQRASAGLIISEASQISPMGQGYLRTPGIHSAEQVAGWRKVTDAVHAAGGRMVIQLWHVGRVSHLSLLPEGEVPVAPSAIRADTKTFIESGFADVSEPRALRLDEIPAIVEDYRRAARNAMDAGFDGVEIHGANGYLIDQFLKDSSNRRDDEYGGSIESRTRFLYEVAQAVTAEIGGERTGLRLSPVSPANDAYDSDPQALFGRAVQRLAPFGLAYIHVIEGATQGPRDLKGFDFLALRKSFAGAWIANNGYDGAIAAAAIESGATDMVAFGRAFIANPDLPRRLREGAPLNEPNRDTFYGGGAEGYTDYPTLG